jgi:hypothetical protein
VKKQKNRPDETGDDRAQFAAWRGWMQDGPDWLRRSLLGAAHTLIDENKVTPAEWAEMLWLSEGHE